MPGFDGTGPYGGGPMTGRGFGYCAVPVQQAGYNIPTYGYAPYRPYGRPRFSLGFGRGLGRGRGPGGLGGRGWRRWW
ncbi:MAG: DUF5320 domain-containing protein [Bacillota bacterium]|nr:DUF5320 domain-containing protein [Bacillota bacterium]